MGKNGRKVSCYFYFYRLKRFFYGHTVGRQIEGDTEGKPFGFSTHMFRRSYGAKLTELHLDDWTIAKLLGHKGVSAVQHYRRMGNQMLADETRRAREEQTRILLASLDGWEEEYEQIR